MTLDEMIEIKEYARNLGYIIHEGDELVNGDEYQFIARMPNCGNLDILNFHDISHKLVYIIKDFKEIDRAYNTIFHINEDMAQLSLESMDKDSVIKYLDHCFLYYKNVILERKMQNIEKDFE